jgi:hypothetical protein
MFMNDQIQLASNLKIVLMNKKHLNTYRENRARHFVIHSKQNNESVVDIVVVRLAIDLLVLQKVQLDRQLVQLSQNFRISLNSAFFDALK